MTVFGWCVGLMFFQFGALIPGDVQFNVWTVVAIAVLAAMLFQLFRPMPKYDDAAKAGKLAAETSAA